MEIVPRFRFKKIFGYTNVFHSHFSPKKEILNPLPVFYQNIVSIWKDCSSSPLTSSNILNQSIWHSMFLKIENKPYLFSDFARANLNYVSQLFNADGSTKNWNEIKNEFALENNIYFKYFQIIHSLPPSWRSVVEDASEISTAVNPTQGMLQCTKLFTLEKLISKQIYAILIRKRDCMPTSKTYYTIKFPSIENNWLQIYLLPRKVTKNAYDRMFQYKIFNNILFLNKKLFLFGKSETSLC